MFVHSYTDCGRLRATSRRTPKCILDTTRTEYNVDAGACDLDLRPLIQWSVETDDGRCRIRSHCSGSTRSQATKALALDAALITHRISCVHRSDGGRHVC